MSVCARRPSAASSSVRIRAPGQGCPSSRRRTGRRVRHSARSGFASRSIGCSWAPSAQFGITAIFAGSTPSAATRSRIVRPSTTFAAAWRSDPSRNQRSSRPPGPRADAMPRFAATSGKRSCSQLTSRAPRNPRDPARHHRDERRVGHGDDDVARAHEREKPSRLPRSRSSGNRARGREGCPGRRSTSEPDGPRRHRSPHAPQAMPADRRSAAGSSRCALRRRPPPARPQDPSASGSSPNDRGRRSG